MIGKDGGLNTRVGTQATVYQKLRYSTLLHFAAGCYTYVIGFQVDTCKTLCVVLKKVYQKKVNFMQPKVYRAMQRAQGKMLREYFSGVPVENLSKRYGYAIPKIKQLASDYKQGKIDIFDDVNKRKIAMSMMTHQEEVQMLQDKIKALEHALKMSNIKAEGYEIMMDILKKEHGIDLSKKVEAEQSRNSKKGTQK